MASRPNVRSYRVSFDFYITPGVKLLLIANFAVFILEAFLYHFGGINAYAWLLKWFGLVPAAVVPLMRIWQPFTYLFLHDVTYIWHILVNMLMLWMFGRELELVWGKNRFLRYYFLTGVGAGLINVLVKTVPLLWGRDYLSRFTPTIGASGAIFGVMIACAVLFPDRRVYLFPIPIALRMRTVVFIMAAITFFGTLGIGDDRVSHICHLGGMLVGYLYLRRDSYLYRLRNEVSDWKYNRNRKRFEVYINKHKNNPPSRPDRWVN
ncbi:MAG TPA: rhomboid family intramembrane serine protease [Candidatus Acidoferrum sp.]|nr:rhomboid family intramembrane serine protease [Candidatus Acidoferrum sp.]